MSIKYELGSIAQDNISNLKIFKNSEMETLDLSLQDAFLDNIEQNSKLGIDDTILFLSTEKAAPETPTTFSRKSRTSRIKNRKSRSVHASTKNELRPQEKGPMTLKLESFPIFVPKTSRHTYEETKTKDDRESRLKGSMNTRETWRSDVKENLAPCPQQDDEMIMATINKEWLEWQRRRSILDSLSRDEKEKFAILEEAVAKEGFSYQPIDLAQFFIVSHGDIPTCLSRMKKWRGALSEWHVDKVLVRDALAYWTSYDFLSVGGYDSGGRRVYVTHWGNVPVNAVLDDYSRHVKSLHLFWDALTVNVSEIRAGITFVGDFRGFGPSNWSLKLFVRMMQMTSDMYPVRTRRIYLIDPPSYFWIISKFVMMFLPKKFKDRLQWTSCEELKKIIPRSSLPNTVGGTFKEATNMSSWIVKRLKLRHGELWASKYRG